MKNVEVKKLIGVDCVTLEDGDTLYAAIHPELADGKPVSVDFSGVEVYATPFLNSAFGRLYEDLDSEKLNRLLHIEAMSEAGRASLGLVLQNARRYYSDANVRSAVDRATSHLVEE